MKLISTSKVSIILLLKKYNIKDHKDIHCRLLPQCAEPVKHPVQTLVGFSLTHGYISKLDSKMLALRIYDVRRKLMVEVPPNIIALTIVNLKLAFKVQTHRLGLFNPAGLH